MRPTSAYVIMRRTTIMLSEDLEQRAVAGARKLNISFADFVRQAVTEKLPHESRCVDSALTSRGLRSPVDREPQGS